jgi:predicted NAD/FAD-dependent oxidoreductase
VWLPAPGAVQRPSADIAWIADNQRKGISPYAAVFTLHGGSAWSAAHFTDPDEALRDTFCAALDEWASGGSVHMHEMQIKRWRYALPVVLHPQPYLRAEGLPPLYFGGDGFGAPRVEGAVQSGLEIAAALAHELAHAHQS